MLIALCERAMPFDSGCPVPSWRSADVFSVSVVLAGVSDGAVTSPSINKLSVLSLLPLT
jgi:hypothetical protein